MRRRWPPDIVRLEASTCVNWCAICWARISKGGHETTRPLGKETRHPLTTVLLPKIQRLRISRQRLGRAAGLRDDGFKGAAPRLHAGLHVHAPSSLDRVIDGAPPAL